MIGWLLRKLAGGPSAKPAAASRKVSPENCALWHDVSRALDAKPKSASK